MKSIFDNQSIPIECSNCGHKTPKTVTWLKSHKQLTCRCGTVIEIDTGNLFSELRKADKALDDFKRSIGRLNKRK